MTRPSLLAAAAAMAVIVAAAPSIASADTAPTKSLRGWTLEDQLTVPDVRTLAIAEDGQSAAYVVRIADLGSDKTVAVLRHVDLATGTTRDLLRAAWIDDLARIPGTHDWSARIDKGEGVQLYRISAAGHMTPVVVHPATVTYGDSEGATYLAYGHAPLLTGVRSYSWSPDGHWLWYVVLDADPAPQSIRFDSDVTPERGQRRSQTPASASIYLRGPSGETKLLSKQPRDDIPTFFGRNFVEWRGGEVRFDMLHTGADGIAKTVTMAATLGSGDIRVVDDKPEGGYWHLAGPQGGRLSSKGFGAKRSLVEVFDDGTRKELGNFPFAVGDGRASGGFVSIDGTRVIAGYRTVEHPRFGLVVMEKGNVRAIEGRQSLSFCDFVPSLEEGVCVEESQTAPPSLVHLDVSTGRTRSVATMASDHQPITPLKTEPRTWVNRNGISATGFILWPRGFRKGARYPAIVITHGSDADERFVNQENQWEYPAQVFAERGYIVLLINTPSSRQSEQYNAIFDSWVQETKRFSPKTVQDLIWLNDTAILEDAVSELIASGVVNPEHIGIAGYSRGSQSVNVTMTQSQMFRAASSGDGGYLEPAFYPMLSASYDTVYGGPPTDPAALPNYLRLAPSLRGDKVCGAMLLQMAAPHPASIDIYTGFRAAKVPAQISLYPGESVASDETHIFHIPSNRLKAMQENIAWFDYWLLDKRDAGSPFASRYALWDEMRKEAPRTCDGSKSVIPD